MPQHLVFELILHITTVGTTGQVPLVVRPMLAFGKAIRHRKGHE